MDRSMLAHPPLPALPLPLAPAAASNGAGMASLVLPASAALSSDSFAVPAPPLPPTQPPVVPLSLASSLPPASSVTLSPSLIHRPIPIAATPRSSLPNVASGHVSIPSTHSAFSTTPATSAFSPALSSQSSSDVSPRLSAAMLSPSLLPTASADQPPSYFRPSSTSSASDSASPSISTKSIASTASPLSSTRHHRQSSLSSNASTSSPSQHRGSLSSDHGSSGDLLAMSRAESGKDAMEAAADVSPVDEDDEAMDDSADSDASLAQSSGVKEEGDAPAAHMTAGLSAAQLAAVHKGTSCHQCKNTKQLKKLAFCANLFNKRTKPEKRVCRKKYCETCLKKFYNDNLCDIVGKQWICASCRGVCCCAACTRVGSKKAGIKTEANGASHSHSPPLSASHAAVAAAHSTPTLDKRSLLQAGQMVDTLPVSALPVTAATVPAMLPPNAAPLSFTAANTLALRQQQAAMHADLLSNAHLLATLAPAQQQQIQQQQLLLYNQLQQQQLQQQILLNNIQQQQHQQIVAALHQQQQQQQLPSAANAAPLMPLAPLVAPLASAFSQPAMSLPVPLAAPVEHELTTSMLRHSLHDPPVLPGLNLPAHLSPSVSPSNSPSLFTRPLRPSTGKTASPSATKRLHLTARDWPYPTSSPQSSSRALSGAHSDHDSHSPLHALHAGRDSHSAHTTPQSLYRTHMGGLSASGSIGEGMDESGGAGGASAFNQYSSRKDAVFSNLHRLTQGNAK